MSEWLSNEEIKEQEVKDFNHLKITRYSEFNAVYMDYSATDVLHTYNLEFLTNLNESFQVHIGSEAVDDREWSFRLTSPSLDTLSFLVLFKILNKHFEECEKRGDYSSFLFEWIEDRVELFTEQERDLLKTHLRKASLNQEIPKHLKNIDVAMNRLESFLTSNVEPVQNTTKPSRMHTLLKNLAVSQNKLKKMCDKILEEEVLGDHILSLEQQLTSLKKAFFSIEEDILPLLIYNEQFYTLIPEARTVLIGMKDSISNALFDVNKI